MTVRDELRAAAPRAPLATPEMQRALEEQRVQHERGALQAGRSMARGLLLLALGVLVASVLRAGVGRVFLPGWWRHW